MLKHQQSHQPITSYLIATALLLLLAFWLRVDALVRLPPGQSSDEAEIMIDGLQISRHGSYPLYEDFGHPDPLFQLIMAGSAFFFGGNAFTFRLTTGFVGLLSVAVACWAMRQCIRDVFVVSVQRRWLIGLAAAAVLAVGISHITLSRSVYRGILQPLFLLLSIGFLMRGWQREQPPIQNQGQTSWSQKRRLDLFLSGVCLGLAVYTYTAAFSAPFALIAVVLSLSVFQRKTWRRWLPDLSALLIAFMVVAAPLGARLITQPQSVLGRAQVVSSGIVTPLPERVIRLVGQFFTQGDGNPQYNTAAAPLLPPIFNGLFLIGLLSCLWHGKKVASALLVSLLILQAIPVLATDEVPHGLRISGEFAVLPLLTGLGLAALFAIAEYALARLHRLTRHPIRAAHLTAVGAAALLVLTLANVAFARRVYANAWVQLQHDTTLMYDVRLPISDWFFRPDRREFANWITAQPHPLLLPMDEVSQAMTRSWLLPAYPEVSTATEQVVIPPDTQLVIPWALELGDLRRTTRHFALLVDHKIKLLPPFSDESYRNFIAGIDDVQAVRRADGSLLARVRPITDLKLAFEARTAGYGDAAPLFERAIRLAGWRGPETLPVFDKTQALLYTLDWEALGQNRHYLKSFLQLLTQDQQRVAGDDVLIWRWLFPSLLWQPGDVVPDRHTLEIPAQLAPGAYRLVAGLYVFLNQRLPAITAAGQPLGDSVTLGWVKVPQTAVPTLPPEALPVEATFGDTFVLHSAVAHRKQDHVHLSLYWESSVRRPGIDATIFVHLIDAYGRLIAQQDARPWGGQYPTFIWEPGEVVQTDYDIPLDAASNTPLEVSVGMYTFPSLERLSAVQGERYMLDRTISLGMLSDLVR